MMIFLYVTFISAENCWVKAYVTDVRSEYDIGYSINNGEIVKVDMDKDVGKNTYFKVLATVPFTFQFYAQNTYCTDWVLFNEINLTENMEQYLIELKPNEYLEKCNSGVSLTIRNNITIYYNGIYDHIGYNIVIVDHKNQTHVLEFTKIDNLNEFVIYHYEPFQVDIFVSSAYTNNTLFYIETINVTKKDIIKYYNGSVVPVQARPYCIKVSVDLPYFYKIAYKSSDSNYIHEFRDKDFYFVDPEVMKFYLLESHSCKYENGREIITITAEKNYSHRFITFDDIPKECQIDYYPDDNPKYQPTESDNVLYSFIFNGLYCDKFDELVQRCRNGSAKYPICPFINNSLDSLCYNDTVFHYVNPLTNKLYFVTSSSLTNPPLYLLKHQMIVHIKSTDYYEPDMYFKNYDKPSQKHYFTLEGNISQWVSFLILENFKITDKLFAVDTLYMKNSSSIYSNTFYCNNLYLENSSYESEFKYHQVIYVMKNKTSKPMYQFNVERYYIKINQKDWNEEFYKSAGSINTKNVEIFGIIADSHYFDYRIDENIEYDCVPPDLNITIMPIDEITRFGNEVLLNDKPKYHVNLTTLGNWDEIEKDTKVYFTSDKNYVELETDLHSNVQAIEESPYIYKPEQWAPILYQPLNYTNDTSLITYIILTTLYNDNNCFYLINKLLDCRRKDCPDKSPMVDYIIEGKCAFENNIDEVLASVSLDTDKVYILNNLDSINLDLNKLSHQVVVEITSCDDIFFPDVNSMSKTININGKISNKVSYLTVCNSYITVTESPLNIYSLRLLNSEINKYNSQTINTHDLIVDFASHVSNFGDASIYSIKQYCLIVPPTEYNEVNDLTYRISFGNDRWSLYYTTNDHSSYLPIDNGYGYVPYNYADTVALIILAHNFEFCLDDDFVTEIKSVNITLMNLLMNPYDIAWNTINDSKYNVSVNATGEYWKDDMKVNIDFTAFHDLINITCNSSNLNLKKSDVYIFPTHQFRLPDQTIAPYPSETPAPTSIPIKTPVPDFVGSLYEGENINEITDTTKLNQDLDKAFEQLNVGNKEGNKVVIVNANSFDFQKDLIDDQYIKPIINSKINFIDGNLNLIPPDYGDVKVSLNDRENAKLSIKGSGTIAFENTKDEINIEKKASINGSLYIKVPEKVNNLFIDSVDLSSKSSIQCNNQINDEAVTISINKLNVEPQAKVELYSVNVKEILTVSQSSQLELHDVNLKESKLVYNLFNLYRKDLILFGEIGDPPSSFEIISNEEPTDQTYIEIARAEFGKNKCKEWGDKIQYKGKNLYYECSNSYKSLDTDYKLLVAYFRDPPNSGKNGLPKSAIIGIIVGVIVVIIIVIIVVVVIIKKRKNNRNNSSDQGMINNQEVV